MQDRANDLALNRLDVDDITITREDGSSYTVQGSYQLFIGGVAAAGPYPTGTGLDLLPGSYDFVLRYLDANGPKTQRPTLTF